MTAALIVLALLACVAAWLAGHAHGYAMAMEQAHEALPELTPDQLRAGACL